MAMTLIASNVFLMLCLGILNVVSILSMEGICVAALAPAVMTISGSIFQPFWQYYLLMVDIFYFTVYSFVQYSIIAVCKFNELYC